MCRPCENPLKKTHSKSKWQAERGCGNHVKTYRAGKKGGVAKIYSGESAMKEDQLTINNCSYMLGNIC